MIMKFLLASCLLSALLSCAAFAFEKPPDSSHNKTRRELQQVCGSTSIPHRDLGIRFNKVAFPPDYVNTGVEDGYLPLTPLDYPICPDTANFLRKLEAYSVTIPQDCGECDIPLSELVDAIGGYPTHPTHATGPVVTRSYWDELRELITVRERRLAGNSLAADFLPHVPDIWSTYNGDEMAEAVHDEIPGSIHIKLIDQLLDEGVEIDRDMIPAPSHLEFVRGAVALSDLNTWAIAQVAPHNFQVKWAAGRARPEEVVWWIHETPGEELIDNYEIPLGIVQTVKNMGLNNATDFTAYDEGSPQHPSWPAMHSAASSASLWMTTVLKDLTEAQKCQILAVDYAVAYARTVAGVHFRTDNIAGLNLGQEVLAKKLARHLRRTYGANSQLVRRKIRRLRFNWNDYLNGFICGDYTDL